MTFWWSEDNYGQLLQCYALQKYLRDAGHDAYLIRYDPRNDKKVPTWRKIIKAFNPNKLFKYVLYMKLKAADLYEKENNPRNFEDFRSKNIKQSEKFYYSYNELVKDPPVADMYIVGSDQIWNFREKVPQSLIFAYLLHFGRPEIIRISYAVSFGKERLSDNLIQAITPLLQKFNYVSVREKSGLDICKQCGINNAECVSDPTMLLDIDVYRSLYKDEPIRKPGRPYCFLYLLGNEYNFSIQAVYDWAENKNVDVVYISGNLQHDKYKKIYATIPEWIYLLEHAEYVITNSYHCSIFSLLFAKEFVVIPLAKEYKGMNTRFDSIFELFGIGNRYIGNDFSGFDTNIDWYKVCNMFKSIRNSCKLLDICKRKNRTLE